MENQLDTPSRMGGLHSLAHRKNHTTYKAVCSMNTKSNTITCMASGTEMLRVGPDGFWVRGKKVEQDDNEAEAVYNAFKAWMTWAQLNKDYQ
jgi:hypothetical protein